MNKESVSAKSAGATRRERVRALYRDDVLAAALVAFSKKGYEKTTMQEIAERADLAVGSIYNVFPSKQALYGELARSFMQSARLTFDAAFDQDLPELERLHMYIRVKGEFFRQNLRMGRLFFGEMRMHDFTVRDHPDGLIHELEEFVLERLVDLFQSGRMNGVFRLDEGDAFSLAFAVQSLTSAFIALWLRHPERYPYPQSVEPVLKAMLGGIVVRGLSRPTTPIAPEQSETVR